MEVVTYKIGMKLKEKGFREECLAYYTSEHTLYNNTICLTEDKYLCLSDIDYEEFLKSNNEETRWKNICDAPTISQVLKWLREEKNIFIVTFIADDSDTPLTYEIYLETECLLTHHGEYFTIQEWNECNLAGIEYVIDNNLI